MGKVRAIMGKRAKRYKRERDDARAKCDAVDKQRLAALELAQTESERAGAEFRARCAVEQERDELRTKLAQAEERLERFAGIDLRAPGYTRATGFERVRTALGDAIVVRLGKGTEEPAPATPEPKPRAPYRVGEVLASGNATEAVQRAVTDLRAKYPGDPTAPLCEPGTCSGCDAIRTELTRTGGGN